MLRAAALLLTLTLVAPIASAADGVPIIGYHEVDPEPTSGWGARTEDFVEQMELLAATGFHVIPVAQLYDYLSGKTATLPPHAIVLTVDDGWLCAYTQIAPVLRRFAYPWSLYVYPAIIGHGTHALTWPQVLELQAQGVDIEDHTMTHAHLMHRSHLDMTDAAYASWLHEELAGSKGAIEHETGRPVRFIAYPYGDHDGVVEQEAARDGYLLGLTSEIGMNTRATNPMQLHRLAVISDTTLDQFRAAIGLGALQLDNVSSPVLTTRTFTATVANFRRFPADAVHISVLGDPHIRGLYDPMNGHVSIAFTSPRAREEVVIRADDGANRDAAIVTVYATQADRDRYVAMHDKLQTLPLHHTQQVRGQ